MYDYLGDFDALVRIFKTLSIGHSSATDVASLFGPQFVPLSGDIDAAHD
jgi:hypothetical protein